MGHLDLEAVPRRFGVRPDEERQGVAHRGSDDRAESAFWVAVRDALVEMAEDEQAAVTV